VRILHTSDWHVGKTLKGVSRRDEQLAVLAQIVEIARAERPDLVIVAGDLFDTAAPPPDATRMVTRALSALRATGAEVVAIAGNHDNGAALDALRSWAEAAGVALRGTVRDRPADHRITGTTAAGEPWRLVALPFLSQRYAIRATEMFALTAAEATQTYADHLARLVEALTGDFDGDAVNLVTAHLTLAGGTLGGGERDAHTVAAYAVPPTIFPAATHYVALGHLHRSQVVPGPCPIHYSGSPVAVDFGEEENAPSVTIVEVGVHAAARTRRVPVTAATPLRTIRGSLAELSELAGEPTSIADAWLRVYVRERPRAGLREAVAELLPRALEVRIDPAMLDAAADPAARPRRSGRSARDLFADYLTEKGHADPAVAELFDRLHAEVLTAGHDGVGVAG
jgi:exonuclease SbcD